MNDLRPWCSHFQIQHQTPKNRRTRTRSATDEPQSLHWKKSRTNGPPEEPHELASGARGDVDTTAAEEKPEDKSPARHRRLHHTDADHGHHLARSDGSARHHTSQPLATVKDDAEKGIGPEEPYSMRRRLPQLNDVARNPNPTMYRP